MSTRGAQAREIIKALASVKVGHPINATLDAFIDVQKRAAVFLEEESRAPMAVAIRAAAAKRTADAKQRDEAFIDLIRRCRGDGGSLSFIAIALTSAGHPPPRSRYWHTSTIRDIMKRHGIK